ncbi:hypothetical protein PSYMO_29528 [Pseudomonas amygdali pv. mori str. 301020]|uniref:Uncharacterized protein n=1 Tax=Pseudomonas amygdali pv. mori str. 301020 TaxID=629261 RepID=A0A656GIA0_PSEA0|nr:hypothetical protein PSYMO_29528 [Pseudomonas amygdali pv. mori str. 301020]
MRVGFEGLDDAELGDIRHLDVDFRRRNIVREGFEQVFGIG